MEASHWILMWVYITELYLKFTEDDGQRSASNRKKGMHLNVNLDKDLTDLESSNRSN